MSQVFTQVATMLCRTQISPCPRFTRYLLYFTILHAVEPDNYQYEKTKIGGKTPQLYIDR